MAQYCIEDLLEINPFSDVGVGKEDYCAIDDITDTDIEVLSVRRFENNKGPGVYVLFRPVGGEDMRYICTHSVGVVGTFTNGKVLCNLELGDTILCRIVKRKSQSSDRMVYAVVSPQS